MQCWKQPHRAPICNGHPPTVDRCQKLFPLLEVPYHLKDQLQRAALSIVLNLAEGSGKRTPADQRRFYSIAFGSLRECQAILDVVQGHSDLVAEVDLLGAHVYRLVYRALE